jgi:cation diffusion facilitator family transporter
MTDAPIPAAERASLRRFAYLSIAAAVLTIGLKASAYLLTGSVGLLSDALESVINLVAAGMALLALNYAARPPDDSHEYGHDKIEYFSGGIEGTLIVLAAVSIGVTSLERFANPHPIEQIGLGLVITLVASLINLVVGQMLMRAGRRYHSLTLEADGHHLMTDVWSSAGVMAGIGLVGVTGAWWLDPLIALLVAVNILRTGAQLMRRAFNGLMDAPMNTAERAVVESVLDGYRARGIQFHALRTRQSGARRFLSVHVLVPSGWTVQRGHDLLERLERDVRAVVPNAHVLTHLEPLGDPAALADVELDR